MENGANNKSTTKRPDDPVTGKRSPDGNIGDDIKKRTAGNPLALDTANETTQPIALSCR